MNDKDFIIQLLQKQVEFLTAENTELRDIIKTFAAQPQNVVVNSYNGSSATSNNDASKNTTTTNNGIHHNDVSIDAHTNNVTASGNGTAAAGKAASITK